MAVERRCACCSQMEEGIQTTIDAQAEKLLLVLMPDAPTTPERVVGPALRQVARHGARLARARRQHTPILESTLHTRTMLGSQDVDQNASKLGEPLARCVHT